MKKTITILLAAVILALCLSGCGSKAEIEFGAKVYQFIGLAMDNANDILELCAVEYEQLRDDGIGAESMGEDYFNKCADRFRRESGVDVELLANRRQQIDQEYEKIMDMDVNAENADDLKKTVQQLYESHQKLLARSTTIYGPAEDFLNECSSYFADVSGAHSDAVDLLHPYYQKPGFTKLIN